MNNKNNNKLNKIQKEFLVVSILTMFLGILGMLLSKYVMIFIFILLIGMGWFATAITSILEKYKEWLKWMKKTY